MAHYSLLVRGLLLIGCTLATALTLTGTAGAAGPTKPATMQSIKIGTAQFSQNLYWDLMVAKQQKLFQQNNLDPTFVSITDPSTLVAATTAGSTNFVAVATDAVINAIDKGGALKLIAGEALASYSVVAKSSIRSYADLKGKKIGIVNTTSGSTLLLLAALRKQGITADDVQLVPAGGTPQRLAALAAGTIDATLLSQPSDFQAQDQGFTILGNTASAIRRYQLTAHGVNSDWARSNRPAVIAYVRTIRQAQQFLWNPRNKAKAIQIYMDVTGQSRALVEKMYKLMFVDAKTLSVNAQIEPTAINNVLAAMARTVGGGPRTAATYYDATFLAQSLPPVKVTSFAARRVRGVLALRVYATRASKATVSLIANGRVRAKVTAKLKAGANRLGIKLPAGAKGKVTLRAVIADSAGNTITKTARARV